MAKFNKIATRVPFISRPLAFGFRETREHYANSSHTHKTVRDVRWPLSGPYNWNIEIVFVSRPLRDSLWRYACVCGRMKWKNFVFWQSVLGERGEGERVRRKKIRQCKLMRSFFFEKVQKKKLMICCKLDFLIGGTERAPKLAVFNSMKSPLATRKLGEIKHTVSLARARERRARKTRLNG